MGTTTDPHDGCLHEVLESGQQRCYLVLPDGSRKDLVRPVRRSYTHATCGTITSMAQSIAETYAANPSFYGATFCVTCRQHYAVAQFTWVDDGTVVGS